MVERPGEVRDDGERGSAVVDFVLVSLLIVTLLLAVPQVVASAPSVGTTQGPACTSAEEPEPAPVPQAAGCTEGPLGGIGRPGCLRKHGFPSSR